MKDEKERNELIKAIYNFTASISDPNAHAGKDAAGGYVTCVTEALMGNTAGLVMIAEAINNLAEAVRDYKE